MTRMKKVFKTSSEVSHLWAHQTQSEARCHNTFFDGPLYFSYGRHYCLGRVFPGNRVALNIESNSPTTNKHRREAMYATNHMQQVHVFDPEDDTCRRRPKTQRHAAELLREAAIARANGRRPMLLGQARKVVEDYNTMCDWLGEPESSKLDLPQLTEEETAAFQKAHRESLARERKREQARAEELAKRNAEAIKAWRAGTVTFLPYGVHTMMLRLGDPDAFGNPQAVQTSRGASIPVEDAKRLWRLIRVVKGSGHGHVQRDFALGNYSLTQIRKDGSVVVGCHDIPYKEIEGIAVQLGLIEALTSTTVMEAL